jgi:hypothetical protein
MASGYKAFVAATVLDAADLTDYCSSQAVMRFANAAARDAALTVSIVKEGMVAYLQDTNVVQVNTDSTTTGWKQIYPVITAGITDGQITNAKMASDSVASANIIDGTIVGGDIATGTITGANILDRTITNTDIALDTIQGFNIAPATITASNIAAATITGSNIAAGTITGSNILDRTITNADIALNTIEGFNIALETITGANIQDGSIGAQELVNGGTYPINVTGNAGTASNAALLDGFNSSYSAVVDTIPVRDAFNRIQSQAFITDDSTPNQFYNNGTYTQIGQFTARVVNASTVYSEAVTSARTVLINSAGTLGTSVSSRRYKVDIETLKADTDKILQLEPVTFYYLPEMYEEDQDKHLEVGLIAEQAAELGLEELVHRNPAGDPEGIAYEKLAVYLLKVCQTQQTQIDALSARLDKIGA